MLDNYRFVKRCFFPTAALIGGFVLISACGESDASKGECTVGDEGCACFSNRTCNGELACLSKLCVSASGGGGSADGGSDGTDDGPEGGAAGDTSGGTGGNMSGGTGGTSGGTAGTSGGTGGNMSGGTGGSASDECNGADSTVIDNFATCDTNICSVGGRNGVWFSYSSNNNIGIQCQAGVPPVSWSDRSCAYYCTNGVAGATWAGAGFDLKDPGGKYSLASYTGVIVKVETGQSFRIGLNDINGDKWHSEILGGSGVKTYSVPFATFNPDAGTTGSVNLSGAVGIRFDIEPADVTAFGLAIHSVTLY